MSKDKQNNFFTFLLMFFAAPFLLKVFGILKIDFFSTSLLGLMLSGLVIVYFYFGTKKKAAISIGAILFLICLLLLILERFPVLNFDKIILPSIFFIVGINLLLLYLNNTKEKIFLLLAFVVLLINIFLIAAQVSINIDSIVISIKEIVLEFWMIFVLIFLSIIILSLEEKK